MPLWSSDLRCIACVVLPSIFSFSAFLDTAILSYPPVQDSGTIILTEKYWQLAEADRLLNEAAHASLMSYDATFWAGTDQKRWQTWEKVQAYVKTRKAEYETFCRQHNLPLPETPPPLTQAEKQQREQRLAEMEAWRVAHPEEAKAQAQANAASFEKWFSKEGKTAIGEADFSLEEGKTDSNRAAEQAQEEQKQIQEKQLLLREQELLTAIETWKKQRNPNNDEALAQTLEQEKQTLPETIELNRIQEELQKFHE